MKMMVKKNLLKKKNEISKFGPYVEICYNAMINLNNHTDFDLTDREMYERNFVISLSYMMGKYDGDNEEMSGLIVGGDCNKYIFSECMRIAEEEDNWIDSTRRKIILKADYVAPDVVIHKNNKIKDINEKKQKLVIEVKTKDDLKEEEFYRDFFKLNVYLSRLKFRHAVYLLINTSVNVVNQYLKGYVNKKYYVSKRCKNRMIFMIQEKNNPSLYVIRDQKSLQLI